MKKLIYKAALLFCSFLVIQTANAQTVFRLGIKAGVSIPNLQSSGNNPVSSGWSSGQGPYAGVVAELQISSKFYLQGELNYSSQGGKKDGVQAIPTLGYEAFFPPGTPVPPYLFADFYSEAKFGYLELPVLLKAEFSISKTLWFFVNGGPYFGYILSAKNITSGSSKIYFDENLTQVFLPTAISFDQTMDIKSDLKKFNFGIQGGVGLALNLANLNKLTLTVGGNYGLVPIQKDEANGKNNIGAATAALGYIIRL